MTFFLRMVCGHEFAIIKSVKNNGRNKRQENTIVITDMVIFQIEVYYCTFSMSMSLKVF